MLPTLLLPALPLLLPSLPRHLGPEPLVLHQLHHKLAHALVLTQQELGAGGTGVVGHHLVSGPGQEGGVVRVRVS